VGEALHHALKTTLDELTYAYRLGDDIR